MSCATARSRRPGGVYGFLNQLRLAGLALVAVLVAACGGEDAGLPGGPGPQGCADCGTALLTITDAPGDFQSYAVDITSLELVKVNGAVVQTLPATTRIDFAELVDLGEVLSARQIPAGAYVAARVRVDYSDAEIVVEDELGGSLEVAPVDADGAPLGEVELTVRLDGRNRLVINRGRLSHLSFDLNLEASNTVDLAGARVTVSPFIVASIVPPGERDWRSRGRLIDVDEAGSNYTVQVRPFHHHQHSMGEMVVHTTAETTFEIDGLSYTGAPGLAQLAMLDEGTMVIAFGTLRTGDYRFTARRVLAGESIPDLQRDHLSGNVLARSGDTLVVGGVRLYRAPEGDVAAAALAGQRPGRFLERTVTLLVGPGTTVTQAGQGAGGALTSAAISVGQRIQAIGEVSGVDDETLVMDATAGLVRMDFTRISGQVASSAPGALTLQLYSIHGMRPDRFDFAGTGLTLEQDADPAAYEVALGAGLDASGLQAGAYTRVFGFVSPFGLAPPDFNARTLIDYAPLRASLGLLWVPGGTSAPFTAISSTGLTLNLGVVPAPLGGIRMRGGPLFIGALPAGLTLAPAGAAGERAFAIAHRGSGEIDTFSDFGEFAAALEAALGGGAVAYKLHAYGAYEPPSLQFSARQVLVVLGD